ncbi:glycosyltransferase family 4 protein [Aestuariivirga sp. YIM B02566]|uniref:Glycosyltransferase family 1 protein n=1 Tax=Taklimakanibacter albus TaxID=2800327 RepID=A0ACC5QY09_9HYPH|nr:glycosyltransferase family 1 protein [Aestuariivirga sp. YIM B02566]MBK1865101.1 glycosyltransferase family 1 protein [Aestuariivirga sp. YIM B02566]
MRIVIVTDAWSPQVNGVVRTLRAVTAELQKRGHQVHVLSPEGRRTVPMPYYPEIRLALTPSRVLGREIRSLSPDAIYIATEGPLGWAARRFCRRANIPFTSGFHTRFADYLALRVPIPGLVSASWSMLRDFHKPSQCVLVPTRSVAEDLERRAFTNLKVWTRGVDHTLFTPGKRAALDYPRPIMLHAGRIAPEKNIEAFLSLDLPGTKLLVGDGPQRADLEKRFPDAVFLGFRFDQDLARLMASADVFVFPSLTDTFGLVMLEAMASGTPVAAFDVPSPIDVVADGVTGVVDKHLKLAILRALALDRGKVHDGAQAFTWERTAQIFEESLKPIPGSSGRAANGITTSLAPSRSG